MNILNFLSQVKKEFLKLVWPSRSEAFANLVLVLAIAGLLSIFLATVDLILVMIISWLLG